MLRSHCCDSTVSIDACAVATHWASKKIEGYLCWSLPSLYILLKQLKKGDESENGENPKAMKINSLS